MIVIENKAFDEERALYGSENVLFSHSKIDGPADGESAFKECKNISALSSYFNLRYPFWHVDTLSITDCEMTPLCRAAIWYSSDIKINSTMLHGIKALRECKNIEIDNCDIASIEFGWFCDNVKMNSTSASGEYFMLRSKNLTFNNLTFTGKYSFQYIENATFESCTIDTKDAFWHGKNITVKSSVIKGEYLAWYSENLTLEDCRIIGTQPLCYCKNLKLINCEMVDADLCFEKSEVQATITSPVISIKNVKSGKIYAPEVNEIICDDDNANGEIFTENKEVAC